MNALPAPVRAAIRERRVHLGLTQVEAAAAGAVSPATWTSVEKGRSGGSNLVRAGMCKALGWTIDSIERLERGDAATPAPARPASADGSDAVLAALADFRDTMSRFSDELAALRVLVDRLAATELDRRRRQ